MTHGAGAFEAGDSVILTLKDQALLEEDEHGRVTGLKDEEDELENVHMKEAEVGVMISTTVVLCAPLGTAVGLMLYVCMFAL